MRDRAMHISIVAGAVALICCCPPACGGGDPACGESATHDCYTCGSPGCTEEVCCNIVCAMDEFCCSVEWDNICVGEAASNCALNIPPNDNCADAIRIGTGSTPFSTVVATTDGPPTACGDLGVPQINHDIWFRFVAPPFDGPIVASLCSSKFDTKTAVYDGCECPPGSELACNDNFCNIQSQVSWNGVANHCYTLRVGGFLAAAGTGTLELAVQPGTPCSSDVNTDGAVNVGDLLIIINNWGPCAGCPADVDGNGVVSTGDLLLIINHWGPCP